MKVLVATNATQGQRPDDYCWTIDGELVRLPILRCDNARCGCARGFPGVTSHRATTTAVLVERAELDEGTLCELLVDDIVRSLGGDADRRDHALHEIAMDELDRLDTVAQSWPVGTVIGRSGSLNYLRSLDVALLP